MNNGCFLVSLLVRLEKCLHFDFFSHTQVTVFISLVMSPNSDGSTKLQILKLMKQTENTIRVD